MTVKRTVYFPNSFLRNANVETRSPPAVSKFTKCFARKEGRSSLLFLHFRDKVGRDER